MKRIRFIAIMLCFAMLIGIVPAANAQAKAKDDIVYYQGSRWYSPFGSGFRYAVEITAVVNRTKKTADIELTRGKYEVEWEEMQLINPDRAKALKKEKAAYTSEGHCTGKITYDDYDRGGKTAFIITDLKWTTKKFNLDGSKQFPKYPATFSINGWQKVYVGGLGSGSIGYEGKDYSSSEFFFRLLDGPPKAKKKEYMIKHDNFAFVNEHMAFFNTAPGTAPQRPKIVADRKFADGTEGFLLDNVGYNAIIAGRDKNQIAAINIWLNGRWEGSCRGMSILSGLIFEDKIGLGKVGGADQTYELASPKNNQKLSNYIEFYQLVSNFERKRFFLQNRGSIPGSAKNAKALVKSLKDHPENPVVVGFNYTESSGDKTVTYGHAVLAFRLEDAGGGDQKVIIYDPNEPKEEKYIYVTEDGKAWYRQRTGGSSVENRYDITIKPIELAKDDYRAQMTYPDYPEIPAGYALITATGGVEITVGELTATVVGDQIKGALEVFAERDKGAEETTILVPLGSDRTVRVKKLDGSHVSVETDDTTALITGGANEVSLNPDGSVTAKNDGTAKDENGENKGTLAVVSDKTKSDIFGTTAEMGEGEVTIAPGEEGARVTTGDGTGDGTGEGNKVDITVSGITGSRTFEGIDADGGVDITSKGNESVLSSGGTEIARGTVEERPIEKSGGMTDDPGTDDPGTDKPGTGTDNPEPLEGKNLKAKKGQKKSSVAATVTHKGRKISLKVDMVADKKITYTGKKISPKDLGYEIDLTDLYNEALTEGAGKPKDLFKISYVSKNNLHKSTSGKKASFYAKVTLDEDKARSAGLGDDGIAKLKALVKALNTKLKKNPCTYTVQAVKISAKTSKVNAVVTLKGSKISRVKSIKVSAKVNGK
ncbi:MAG: hypothetical protein ILP10_00180, partial [Lachnospiraceae bacterium]|nr:hypothetical protein [Lachnospiraceae bacterium]